MKALEHHQAGRLQEAVTEYGKILALNPGYAEAHNNLGSALCDLGELEQAALSCLQAIALRPDYVEAHCNLGNVLRAQGRFDEAVASYRQAIALQPGFAAAHFNLANTFRDLGRLDNAADSYREVTLLAPGYPVAHFHLGDALRARGRYEESVVSYRRSISLQPNSAEVHCHLGNALKELDRLDEAVISYREALRIKPDLLAGLCNLGVALHMLGKSGEALACYDQALMLAPHLADLHHNRGNALRDNGQLAEAIASYRQACVENPLHPARADLVNALVESGEHDESLSLTRSCVANYAAGNDAAIVPVTALLPFGRSGSMFVHALLDGHPQISTVPGIYFKGWFGDGVWERFAPDTSDSQWQKRLADRVIQEYAPLFDARSQGNVPGKPFGPSDHLARDSGFLHMGPGRDQSFQLDSRKFSATLEALLRSRRTVSRTECFILIHEAFDTAFRGASQRGNLLYHIHNPGFQELGRFLGSFPRSRLLYVVRHPVQSLESWMLNDLAEIPGEIAPHHHNHFIVKWRDAVQKLREMLFASNSPFHALTESRGIRLEDIKRAPQRVLPQLAAWLGIADDPVLYVPGFCSLEYWGPSSVATGTIRGFETKAIDLPLGRLFGPRDIVIMETLFWPFSRRFGYTTLDPTGFRARLAEIRPWLDEALAFEQTLYQKMRTSRSALESLLPYRYLHALLKHHWTILNRDGVLPFVLEPMHLD